MSTLITGATGLVGKKLVETLIKNGEQDIRVLTRDKKKASGSYPFPVKFFNWDTKKRFIEKGALDGVHTIINLAGENVASGRWTDQRKQRILNSREEGAKTLVHHLETTEHSVEKLISASAVGIYGDRGNEELNELSRLGDDFLAEVCKKWEVHFNKLEEKLTVHSLRIGVVLANEGGALQKMLPPFKAGVGGRLGSGKQYMSWIHIDDLVGMITFLINKQGRSRIYNAVAPGALNNTEFTKVLGKVVKRPTIFPVPGFVLKILFGDMSTILLDGQKVKPQAILEEGFQFKFSKLEDALNDLLRLDQNGEERLISYQFVNKKPSEIFEFFSNENNLEKITPPHLGFNVVGKNTDKIQSGTLIDYKLKLYGLPLKWKSKISEFKEKEHFIDEQIVGPYSKWVHRHEFLPYGEGTLLKDDVVYKVPMGVLGKVFAGPFIKMDLKKIFNYRKQTIDRIFGE